VDKGPALNYIADALATSKGVIGIGSPRASLEANFALRTLVGPDQFYSGMSEKENRLVTLIIDVLQKGPARTPSLHDVESADAVLVLGEDLTNTAPMLDLALRQSVRNKPGEITGKMRIPAWDDNAVRNAVQDETGPLYIASTASTKLDDIATRPSRPLMTSLGFAIAHEVDSRSPAALNLREPMLKQAREIAQALKSAKRPLIISGTSLGSESVIHAAANIAWALCQSGKQAELCYTVPECNSIGLGLMNAGNLHDGIKTVQEGKADTVIILENDLYRRVEENRVNDFLSRAKSIIVLDHLINPTSSGADIVLPAGAFAESDGTLVNNEGRAQRYFEVFMPDHDIQESWRWIRDILTAAGRPNASHWENLDDITESLTAALPVFKPVKDLAPSAKFTVAGQKIPRQSHRYSGRTAMLADISVHEPKPPEDPDSPLSFMEDTASLRRRSSTATGRRDGIRPGVEQVQQEVAGPLKGGDLGSDWSSRGGGLLIFHERSGSSSQRGSCYRAFYHLFGRTLSILSPGIAGLASHTCRQFRCRVAAAGSRRRQDTGVVPA
jgi:NADH-quinone oxidoreductase subunit G